jgi:hypothetical protein
LGCWTSQEVNGNVFIGDRFKEWKSDDVIQVRMGEDDAILESVFTQQLIPQASNSGTRIHDNDLIILGSDLKTSGIASISEVLRARYGYGTSCAVATYDHLPAPSSDLDAICYQTQVTKSQGNREERGQMAEDTVEGRCPKDQLFGCCLSGAWEMATEEDLSGLLKAISGFILKE